MTEPARIAVRQATSDEDLRSLIALTAATTPDEPTTLEDLRWSDATYPGGLRWLADLDGTPVGVATLGRIYVQPPEYPDLWATLGVVEAARRRGVGSALLAAMARAAEAAGKTGLQLRCRGDRTDAIEFLVHRGFTELERSKTVRLHLAGRPAPTVQLPDGLALTSLAQRPELVAGVHALALEAFADIPGGDDPMAAGDLDEFRARDVDRPGIPAEAFMVAVETATDRVVGYASLLFPPGTSDLAWHDMTAVARAWRGRGLATTLKLATIAWAIERGVAALESGNDEANGPMRAVNARLGYEPELDSLILRGAVARGIMGG